MYQTGCLKSDLGSVRLSPEEQSGGMSDLSPEERSGSMAD